jgi:hypothetical protein
MGLKGKALYQAARIIRRRIEAESAQAVRDQHKILARLIHRAKGTQFGRDHGFDAIRTHDDLTRQVPIRDYEQLRPWVDAAVAGQSDILWPGKPLYLAKTSGTTSGVKYIPLTRESMPGHIAGARDALFNQVARRRLTRLFNGKMIFLSGSPVLGEQNGIRTGRLSGIVNHWVPAWLRGNQLPTYATNCIEDWETKVDQIAKETVTADMTLISGIPPWVQMYYERLLELTGKATVRDIFPNLQLFVYGGVQYEPYRSQLEALVGDPPAGLETYPASEGFIAFQDLDSADDGLLLRTRAGMFYEFVPLSEAGQPSPTRLALEEVETGVQYAIVLSTNAGLWAYDLGDTVEFVSLNPYRIRVTGRVKHFISAFGEHVIAKEVEDALREAVARHACRVNEFTVAPQVTPPEGGKPYHEWYIEFAQAPEDLDAFARDLDEAMVRQNIYYRDLIQGGILRPLVIRNLPAGSFVGYMQSIGKLGGQNKVPRLSNDRRLADGLSR